MSSFTEGQILDGTYRLVRLIGEGGMGQVYEATHARLAGRYAIKVLLQTLSNNRDAVARFDREARVTSLLQHPNIVQVIDHNTAADGTEYLVMEYLDGVSLAGRMARSKRLSVESVVAIVEQIAAGLAAAHAHGIVHRDLKPDNVFLVKVEGRATELVKLLDFGISKVGSGYQTLDRQICGTPQYMAPEQIEGRVAEIGGATDQFALAVIAYELLTGRNPFMKDDLAATFAEILRGVPRSTDLSPAVDAVLARGMAKAWRNRFPTVTNFAAALRVALLPAGDEHSLPTLAYAVGEIDTADLKTSRTSRWGVPVVLALGTALAGVFLYQGGLATLRSRVGFPVAAVAGADAATWRRPTPVSIVPLQPQNPIAFGDAAVKLSAPPAPDRREVTPPEPSPPVDQMAPVPSQPIVHRALTAARSSQPHRVHVVAPSPIVSRNVVAPRLSTDDDAIMPLDETVGSP